MIEKTLLIEPRDPLIFRDGKPFGAGLSARTIGWPMPSAVIGPIRTRLGSQTSYDEDVVTRLLAVEHCGPFLAVLTEKGKWELAFPAPADALLFDHLPDGSMVEVVPLRPSDHRAGEGTDLPGGLKPLMGAREQKPSSQALAFWSEGCTLEWLSKQDATAQIRKVSRLGPGVLNRQRRVHTAIDPGLQSADEGLLFSTEGLEFEDRVERKAICSRIRYDSIWPDFDRLAPLGGERRLAVWSEEEVAWPAPPASIDQVELLRVQLLTPAKFSDGWKPGWIKADRIGNPPGTDLRLELIAAAIPRALPISGWDIRRNVNRPKPTRFLAPAGSVFFFRVLAGNPAGLWMKSICDVEQDRRDGFGLVLCGVWTWRQN